LPGGLTDPGRSTRRLADSGYAMSWVTLGKADVVFVAEVTDLVTEHQQHAVVFRNLGET
jgi:hypothetical protein